MIIDNSVIVVMAINFYYYIHCRGRSVCRRGRSAAVPVVQRVALSGVLGGVGAVVGRRGGASAVLALWGCGGPWGGPAAGAGIVAGRLGSVLLSIVAGADGGPGPLAVVVAVSCPAWAGPPAGPVAGAVAGLPLRLPGLLAALPGVVRGRDRVGGRSSCCRGPVSVRDSSPSA